MGEDLSFRTLYSGVELAHSGSVEEPMPHILMDPESESLGEHYALVRSRRRDRPRFPTGCVTLMLDAESALAGADPGRHLYPALIYGPSRSSEGQQVWYLVRWLSPR